jgi:hypothetical protein
MIADTVLHTGRTLLGARFSPVTKACNSLLRIATRACLLDL